jgi:hypothetical protein
VFDILTFLTLRLGFHASAALSRSGWFIESTITELAVMLVLHQPAPSTKATPALLSSIAIAAITITLPYSPLAGPLGLTAIPAWILAALAGLTAFYVIANEGAKHRFPLTTRSTNPASTVALDELIAQHTTRPAAISVYQPGRPPPAAGMPERAGARPPSRSSSPARTSSSAGGSGSA